MMNEEGAFPRLVELIHERKDDEAGLHRMLLELLYEMSRIQRLRVEDLSKLDQFQALLLQHVDQAQCSLRMSLLLTCSTLLRDCQTMLMTPIIIL